MSDEQTSRGLAISFYRPGDGKGQRDDEPAILDDAVSLIYAAGALPSHRDGSSGKSALVRELVVGATRTRENVLWLAAQAKASGLELRDAVEQAITRARQGGRLTASRVFVPPAGVDMWAGTHHDIAERAQCHPTTVYRWQRRNAHLRP